VWSARAVAVKYNSCYAQPATSAAIKKCNKTYHMRKELTARNSDDVCQSVSISLSLSLSLSLYLTLSLFVCSALCGGDRRKNPQDWKMTE